MDKDINKSIDELVDIFRELSVNNTSDAQPAYLTEILRHFYYGMIKQVPAPMRQTANAIYKKALIELVAELRDEYHIYPARPKQDDTDTPTR